jgi:hypothetical protein
MDRFNALLIDSYARFTTPELIDLIHRRARPRGYMAALEGTIGLLDAMIHQQDIRRPLGMPRSIPAERLEIALERSLYVPMLRAAWRSRGLRLIATDVDWTHGSGLEVRATGEAFLMSLAGRRAAFSEIAGFFGYRLIDWFEHEDGNQSTCSPRVVRVRLEGVHGTIPPDRSLVTDEFASEVVADRRQIL